VIPNYRDRLLRLNTNSGEETPTAARKHQQRRGNTNSGEVKNAVSEDTAFFYFFSFVFYPSTFLLLKLFAI
jgi:hypothetical protein